MHSFNAVILKFDTKGEKTGWTYVEIPPDIIPNLKLKNKKEFRIKGVIDDVKFERMACFPIGGGNFIFAINASIRKQLGKKEGAMVSVKFEKDTREALKSDQLLECLQNEPEALAQFNSLTKAHQNYFHAHINTAKTGETKAKRIVHTIEAMYKKMDFGAMIRSHQKKNQ